MEILKLVKNYSIGVDREIENALDTLDPENLHSASNHIIKAGGKKIRPALVLLTAEAVGGNRKWAYKTAAAVELIHTFSLIHDDIMDGDEMRRGMPAVHTLWGEPMAILAGDVLFSKAFELVTQTQAEDIPSENVITALKTVVDSCIKICEGQALDMDFEGKLDVKEEDYLKMIYKKTAALIAAATKSGAIIGGGSEEQVEALSQYGELIGMAFQIQDDYLDVISDEEELGKPVGSDIVEGKMTLMVVHTLEAATDADKEELISILESGDESNTNRAIEIFNKYDSITYARDIALENVNQAKKLLDMMDDSPAKEALYNLADFVLERKN
ncbi:MAG TPA: short chain isoprenyl diphosphate synthase IdsA [Methanobacterium sp.]|nr:MAG: polyprenyl synthetase family protein [Methanobacterium sp.]HOI70905.1 short chain isoprenyl diphosphate synthase IdsA [Methanobacterium sp.]HPX77631.1 short chain isoprenyl diphosphate synthase IdsA [Methanobacterium sp.]